MEGGATNTPLRGVSDPSGSFKVILRVMNWYLVVTIDPIQTLEPISSRVSSSHTGHSSGLS
jgi:hypothetical protein